MVTREDEAFDSLVESFIREYLEFNPLMGTHLGLHEYDPLMPDLSRERLNYAIQRLEWYLKRFREIEPERLTGSRRVEYEPIVRGIEEGLILTRDWPTWRMYPVGFDAVGSTLFSILIRDHLPLEHRLFSLYSRVRAVEKVLRDSIDNVDEPYALWLDYVATMGRGLPQLLEVVKSFGREHGYSELVDACERAIEAVKKGLERIEDLKARARPGFKPIGKELFRKLLWTRFIEEDIEALRIHGYREAERYRKLMEEAARDMGVESIEQGLAKLREKHASSPDEVIKLYRETLKKVRDFVIEKQVVELPPLERIEIVETPEFMKPLLPFAAYIPPEILSWSFKGVFLVTKPLSEDMLKHHNIYDILNTVVHEAYPGHHVQLSYAKMCPSIVRRILIQANDLVEGWAHYCEELMLELGIDTSPEYRLKVYHDALWRAVRVYVDIELSTGTISFEQAVEKLMKDAYLPREGAFSEALRYTMSPGYQVCYNYGKTRILKLREEVRKILGPRYSHSLFHRWLLEEGSLPLAILERIVLEKARKMLSREE